MPNPPNLFQELKNALSELKTFLDQNVNTIKPAINALAGLVPQIKDAINELIRLLGRVKQEVQNLNASAVPGLDKVTAFTAAARTLLTTAKSLLPNESGAIDTAVSALEVVNSLPSIDQLKTEIIQLIDAVIGHLNTLKG